jgi:Spy/CpxP family protein refolding chaperone
MVEVSLSEIQERLSLTEMQISQLRPVYKQYQKKVARLNMQNHKLFNRMNADTLSDEQAKTVLREYLDRERKLYALNKQYMDNLLEILSPQQVIKLYQSDSDIKRKIRMEYLRRTGKPKR